jgi:cysteine desulfurase
MSANIYLDNAATTTARPEVVEVMLPLLSGGYNPSSAHAHGREARRILDTARADVAGVLGAAPREIVFTGSGTEADVLAIVGAARARAAEGRHVVTSAIEHHAVLHAFDVLESEGWTVTRLPVSARGLVDPAAVAAALGADTTLVSIMLGNNEIGTIQPLAEIAALAHARGALVHTDAVATAAYLDLDVRRLNVDLLSLSAHKFNGPKGCGVLFVRRGTPLVAQIVGGGQEHGLRSGTENVAGVAGLARALVLAAAERTETVARVSALRERLAEGISRAAPGSIQPGAGAPRLPHILSMGFPHQAADALLMALDLEGVSASAGSACAAGSLEPSHVVAALGLGPEYAAGVLRFSLGRFTTAADVEAAARVVGRVFRQTAEV